MIWSTAGEWLSPFDSMRDQQRKQVRLISYIFTQDRIQATQPLRQVRVAPCAGSAQRRFLSVLPGGIVPRSYPKMLGADKDYDTRDFEADLRISGITPHVAQKIQARCSSLIVDRSAPSELQLIDQHQKAD